MILDFARPGKPMDNAFIESFNGKLRSHCLNADWFLSLHDVYEELEAWKRNAINAHNTFSFKQQHCPRSRRNKKIWSRAGNLREREPSRCICSDSGNQKQLVRSTGERQERQCVS